MYGHSPPLEGFFLFVFLVQHLAWRGAFTLRKPLMRRTQEKHRTSQQRGNVSARADAPPLRWRPIPQSPGATEPNTARCHGSYSFFFFLLLCFLAPEASFFSFSFLAGRTFGLVRDRSGSTELSKELQLADAREGRGREGARHCRPQHPENWQSGTSDRSETGAHTHCWRREECRNKRTESIAAAVFN